MSLWNTNRFLNRPDIYVNSQTEVTPWFNANNYLGERRQGDYKVRISNDGVYNWWGGNGGTWNQ